MQKSLCSEAGIQGCGLDMAFIPLLRGLPHPSLEKGHDVEAGALEISCLVFEVWLGAQCGSPCPATVTRTALHEASSVGVVLPLAPLYSGNC